MNLKFVANDIQLWSLDQLVPYARNARTHSQPQIAQVAASIAEFGFTNPLLIDSHSGILPATAGWRRPACWGCNRCPSSFSII